MYGSLVVGYGISCTIGCWYYGGMNMRGLGVGHSNDPTCELNGGPPSGSPLNELPPCESSSCLPFSGWWAEPLGTWVGKLVLTCTMVGTSAIICCWIGSLSLLIIG
jgi:hypothetical protein